MYPAPEGALMYGDRTVRISVAFGFRDAPFSDYKRVMGVWRVDRHGNFPWSKKGLLTLM